MTTLTAATGQGNRGQRHRIDSLAGEGVGLAAILRNACKPCGMLFPWVLIDPADKDESTRAF